MSRVVAELRHATLGRDGRVVLDGVNLAIGGGEIVAVVGRSGAGKSTLLETAIGLIPPLSGQVQLFDCELGTSTETERNAALERIGVVFQQDALFRGMTVAENLAVAARATRRLPQPVIDELVAIRLDQVGLRGAGASYPYELSGGQQKRIAFARAVMLEPELVVCDEPTAGLDPVNTATVVALIRRLRHELGAAVLLVTHDGELVQAAADRVIVVGNGRVLAEGTPAQLAQHADPAVAVFFDASLAARVAEAS